VRAPFPAPGRPPHRAVPGRAPPIRGDRPATASATRASRRAPVRGPAHPCGPERRVRPDRRARELKKARACRWCWRSPTNLRPARRELVHETPSRPTPLRKLLDQRIAIIDGAMGTTIRTYGPDRGGHPRRTLQGFAQGSAEQRRSVLAHAAPDDRRHPPALPGGRRRPSSRPNTFRRDQHHAERVLRRRSARSRAVAKDPAFYQKVIEDPFLKGTGLGDQRAVRPPMPGVGRSRRQRRRPAKRFSRGLHRSAQRCRCPIPPTPKDAGFRVVTFDQVKDSYAEAGPGPHRGAAPTSCWSRRSSIRSTPRPAPGRDPRGLRRGSPGATGDDLRGRRAAAARR